MMNTVNIWRNKISIKLFIIENKIENKKKEEISNSNVNLDLSKQASILPCPLNRQIKSFHDKTENN